MEFFGGCAAKASDPVFSSGCKTCSLCICCVRVDVLHVYQTAFCWGCKQRDVIKAAIASSVAVVIFANLNCFTTIQ